MRFEFVNDFGEKLSAVRRSPTLDEIQIASAFFGPALIRFSTSF